MKIYAADTGFTSDLLPKSLPKQLGLPFLGREIDVDGHIDARKDGIKFIGKAVHVFDNTYRCLAEVAGAVCVVEVSVTWLGEQKKT